MIAKRFEDGEARSQLRLPAAARRTKAGRVLAPADVVEPWLPVPAKPGAPRFILIEDDEDGSEAIVPAAAVPRLGAAKRALATKKKAGLLVASSAPSPFALDPEAMTDLERLLLPSRATKARGRASQSEFGRRRAPAGRHLV